MARDGITYVAWSGILGIIISIAGVLLNNNILLLCAALFALALLFFAFFFRDPERTIVTDINTILSPGDGFVVAIEECFRQRGLPFEELLMLDGRYVDEIRVKEAVDFLCTHLNGFGEAPTS